MKTTYENFYSNIFMLHDKNLLKSLSPQWLKELSYFLLFLYFFSFFIVQVPLIVYYSLVLSFVTKTRKVFMCKDLTTICRKFLFTTFLITYFILLFKKKNFISNRFGCMHATAKAGCHK